MMLPNWTVRLSGLEKVLFFTSLAQTITLDHSFTGDKRGTYNVDKSVKKLTKQDYSSSFRPFVGINITWKNGMTSNFRYNNSEKLSVVLTAGESKTRQITQDISFTTNYKKRSDFRIPIPIWPFKNMRLKNNVDVQLTFNMTKNITEQSRGKGKFEESQHTETISLEPKLTYSFSNRVNGGIRFKVGKTKNKRMGDSSIQELGIDVNISIRGN